MDHGATPVDRRGAISNRSDLTLSRAVTAATLCAAVSAWGQGFVPRNEELGLPTAWGETVADVGGGVSVVDLNGDGLLDVLVTAPRKLPQLYRGTVAGGFDPVPNALIPLVPPALANGHVVFDRDGDGDLDVLLLRTGQNALFDNQGGMTFVDVSNQTLPGEQADSLSAAAGDLDADGDLDVVIANYIEISNFPRHVCATNAWLENDGAGRFVDRRGDLGPHDARCTLAVALSDADGDGDVDVYEVNDFGPLGSPNRAWRNQGLGPDGRVLFVDDTAALGFDHARYGMGLASGDLDEDGHADVFVTSIGRPLLLGGTAGGPLADMTDAWGAAHATFGPQRYLATWDARVFDVDGDGHQDLVTIPGALTATYFLASEPAPELVVFYGDGTGALTIDGPVATIPPPEGGVGRGLGTADMDDDGDIDLVVALYQGDPYIVRNTFDNQVALRITLMPQLTAGTAGTHIVASCGGEERHHHVVAGGATSGTGGAPLQFTFAGACQAAGVPVDVLVRWPSGYVQRENSLSGAALFVAEPGWLMLSADELFAAPTDAQGAPVGAADVTFVVTGASLGPLVDTGNGVSAAVLSADPGGEVVAQVAVQGEALPAVRRHRGPAFWQLRPVPQRAIVNRPLTVEVVAAVDAGATVTLAVDGGAAVPLTSVGADRFRGELPALAAVGAHEAALSVDGSPFGGPKPLQVWPALDLTRTQVRYSGLSAESGPFLFVSGQLRDANGGVVVSANPDFALDVDGVPMLAQVFDDGTDGFSLSYNTSTWPGGGTLQLLWQGTPLALPQTLYANAALTPQVDAAHSWCVHAMPSLYADGMDVGTVLAEFRDAGGTAFRVDMADLTFAPTGVSVVEDSVQLNNGRVDFQVRAGQTPGPAQVRLWHGADPVPLDCPLVLVPAPDAIVPWGPDTSLLTTDASIEAGAAAPLDRTTLALRPRRGDGRLVGSGQDVTWSTTLGTLTDVAYRGFGRYEATLVAGVYGGVATVTAASPDNDMAGVEVVVIGPPPPGPDAGPADGGGLDDAGVPDAAGPAVDSGVPVVDAGGADAGPRPGPDAGGAADAGPGRGDPDGGWRPVARLPGVPTQELTPAGGCSHISIPRAPGGGPGAALAVLGLLGAAWARTRTGRDRRPPGAGPPAKTRR